MVRNEVIPRVPAAGKAIGAYTGGAPGAVMGQLVGGALARRLAKLVGSGDYEVNEAPVSNSLFPGSSARVDAIFSNVGGDMQRIRFREYVTDIVSTGSASFSLRSLQIQPGMSASFPYLSTIAPSFESYKFAGLVYEYIPMVSPYATSAMGSVMLTCSYNSTAANPSSRASMENLNGCIVHRPDKSSMYGVECEGQNFNGYFVRLGDTLTPNNLEDYGKIFVATAGMSPTQYPAGTVLGELWVTYDVIMYKHRIPLLIPGVAALTRQSCTKAAPFGTANSQAPVFLGNAYPISYNSTKLFFGDSSSSVLGTIAPGTIVEIFLSWTVGTAGTLSIAAPAATNCAPIYIMGQPSAITYATAQWCMWWGKYRLDAINAVLDFSSSITGTGELNNLKIYIHTTGATGDYEPGSTY